MSTQASSTEDQITEAIHFWGRRHNWKMEAVLAEMISIRGEALTSRPVEGAPSRPKSPKMFFEDPAFPGTLTREGIETGFTAYVLYSEYDALESLLAQKEAEIATLCASLAKAREDGMREALEAVKGERLEDADMSTNGLATVAYSSAIEDCEVAILALLSGDVSPKENQ